MRINLNWFVIILIILTLPVCTAKADGYISPMRSIALTPAKKEATQAPPPTATQNAPAPAQEEKTVIWNKYKALIEDHAQDVNDQSQGKAATKPAAKGTAAKKAAKNNVQDTVAKQAPQETAPSPNTGIAGIIAQYRQNKQNQQQMRVLSFPSAQKTHGAANYASANKSESKDQ